MQQILSEILFLRQRFNWNSVIDILLVTAIILFLFRFVRGSQATTLLRGTVIVLIIVALLFVLTDLPAFTWLIRSVMPVILIVIPVVFAPEIRHAFERMGRVQTFHDLFLIHIPYAEEMNSVIDAIVLACSRLADRKHGALIAMQRGDDLDKYAQTGVMMQSIVSPELLLQIFYPNTPLHDGAVIIGKGLITAAACIMPLSSRNVLDKTPDRQMGLRHRAALGIVESSDAIAIVISEETGSIALAYDGRIIRGISHERLKAMLTDLYEIPEPTPVSIRIKNFLIYAWDRLNNGGKE